jgi:hypothetical protein
MKDKILTTTTITWILGVLMYGLGWMYWSSFYKSFNIDSSLIDLSGFKIVATTWPIVLIWLISTWDIVLDHGVSDEPFDIVITKNQIVRLIAMIIIYNLIFILSFDILNLWQSLLILGALCIVTVWIFLKSSFKEYGVVSLFKQPLKKTMVLVFIIIAGLFTSYYLAGKARAYKIKHGKGDIITLNYKSNNGFPRSGVFISQMKGHYFYWAEYKNESICIAIHENDVNGVTFHSNNK